VGESLHDGPGALKHEASDCLDGCGPRVGSAGWFEAMVFIVLIMRVAAERPHVIDRVNRFAVRII
jgi:hypothetical protein